MLSNVGGFVCHIANTIILLYSIVFYPESTETPTSVVVYVTVLQGNMVGLFFAASAGIIVNHMVRVSFFITERMEWSCCNIYFMVDIRHPISSIESGVLYPPIMSLHCDH